MAKNIHGNYNTIAVICTCGNTFETKSTYSKNNVLKVEVCGLCHPFYSGTQKMMDTDRRIDTFYKKYSKSAVNVDPAPATSAK